MYYNITGDRNDSNGLTKEVFIMEKVDKEIKKGVVLDEKITKGVEALKKDSPAAAYKAEKILETQDTVFNNKGSKIPSDSDR
jgi:hypothetical protein